MASKKYENTPSFQTPVLTRILERRPTDEEIDRMEIEFSWSQLPNVQPTTDRDLELELWMLDEAYEWVELRYIMAREQDLADLEYSSRVDVIYRSQEEFLKSVRGCIYPNRNDTPDSFNDYDYYGDDMFEASINLHGEDLDIFAGYGEFDDLSNVKDEGYVNIPITNACLSRLPRHEKKALIRAHF